MATLQLKKKKAVNSKRHAEGHQCITKSQQTLNSNKYYELLIRAQGQAQCFCQKQFLEL